MKPMWEMKSIDGEAGHLTCQCQWSSMQQVCFTTLFLYSFSYWHSPRISWIFISAGHICARVRGRFIMLRPWLFWTIQISDKGFEVRNVSKYILNVLELLLYRKHGQQRQSRVREENENKSEKRAWCQKSTGCYYWAIIVGWLDFSSSAREKQKSWKIAPRPRTHIEFAMLSTTLLENKMFSLAKIFNYLFNSSTTREIDFLVKRFTRVCNRVVAIDNVSCVVCPSFPQRTCKLLLFGAVAGFFSTAFRIVGLSQQKSDQNLICHEVLHAKSKERSRSKIDFPS